jgi:hypothetical protein
VSVLIEARQQALEASRQGADFIGAGGFGHIEANLTVTAHRGVCRVSEASDAQADPAGKTEHDDDRRARGQQREIEKAGDRAVAQGKQLIAGLLENHCAPGLARDQNRSGRRQQQLCGPRTS